MEGDPGILTVYRVVWSLVVLIALRYLMPLFPPANLVTLAGLAVAITGVGWLADHALMGYTTRSGRALVGFVVAAGVLTIYFTRGLGITTRMTADVVAAISAAILIGLGDFISSRLTA
jgi:hypothetical protein